MAVSPGWKINEGLAGKLPIQRLLDAEAHKKLQDHRRFIAAMQLRPGKSGVQSQKPFNKRPP
jgi:hypothetical protein